MAIYEERNSLSLLSEASDADGDNLSVRRVDGTIISGPHTVGNVTINTDGSVTIDDGGDVSSHPAYGAIEQYTTFTFTVWDGEDESPTYTCTINLHGAFADIFVVSAPVLAAMESGDVPEDFYTPGSYSHPSGTVTINDVEFTADGSVVSGASAVSAGQSIIVTETYSAPDGETGETQSTAVTVDAGDIAVPTNTALPAISGTGTAGSEHTASSGQWDIAYDKIERDWRLDEVSVGDTDNAYTPSSEGSLDHRVRTRLSGGQWSEWAYSIPMYISVGAGSGTFDYMMSGAPQPDTATISVVTTSTDDVVDVEWSGDSQFNSSTTVTGGVVDQETKSRKVLIGSLPEETRIYYRAIVNGTTHTEVKSFFTPASGQFSYSFGFGSCGSPNGSGFGGATSYANMAAHAPLFFLALGDTPYIDENVDDLSVYLGEYLSWLKSEPNDVLSTAAHVYTWDDHDWSENNNGAESLGASAQKSLYRKLWPHFPLELTDSSEPIYHAFAIGRVLHIVVDGRSEKLPDGQEVFSATQMAWIKSQLDRIASTEYQLAVIAQPTPWINGGIFPDSQVDEINDYVNSLSLQDKVVMVSGDMHALAFDDGTNNKDSSGNPSFRVCHAAPLRQGNSVKGGPYTHGPFPPQDTDPPYRHQYGMLDIQDDGASITVTFRGYGGPTDNENQLLINESWTIATEELEAIAVTEGTVEANEADLEFDFDNDGDVDATLTNQQASTLSTTPVALRTPIAEWQSGVGDSVGDVLSISPAIWAYDTSGSTFSNSYSVYRDGVFLSETTGDSTYTIVEGDLGAELTIIDKAYYGAIESASSVSDPVTIGGAGSGWSISGSEIASAPTVTISNTTIGIS